MAMSPGLAVGREFDRSCPTAAGEARPDRRRPDGHRRRTKTPPGEGGVERSGSFVAAKSRIGSGRIGLIYFNKVEPDSRFKPMRLETIGP
jgi:hypothetical protein